MCRRGSWAPSAAAGDVGWKIGWRPTLDSGRLAELRAGGYVCSVDRIRDVLGFTATMPLGEGIERTARWYGSRGGLGGRIVASR